jgi:hypothetical protein
MEGGSGGAMEERGRTQLTVKVREGGWIKEGGTVVNGDEGWRTMGKMKVEGEDTGIDSDNQKRRLHTSDD